MISRDKIFGPMGPVELVAPDVISDGNGFELRFAFKPVVGNDDPTKGPCKQPVSQEECDAMSAALGPLLLKVMNALSGWRSVAETSPEELTEAFANSGLKVDAGKSH